MRLTIPELGHLSITLDQEMEFAVANVEINDEMY